MVSHGIFALLIKGALSVTTESETSIDKTDTTTITTLPNEHQDDVADDKLNHVESNTAPNSIDDDLLEGGEVVHGSPEEIQYIMSDEDEKELLEAAALAQAKADEASELSSTAEDLAAVINSNITNPANTSAEGSIEKHKLLVVDPPKEEVKKKDVLVNYAHKNSGAIILENSKSLKGSSNLLVSDRDKYAIAPCEDEEKWVIIALPEDILVKSVEVSNFEKYSSTISSFQLLGTSQIPKTEDDTMWENLGVYNTTKRKAGGSMEETFNLSEPYQWVRYLKIVFLDHLGVEFYCTVSQVKVHGSTMLQGYHEQYRSELTGSENSNSNKVPPKEELVAMAGVVNKTIASDLPAESQVQVQLTDGGVGTQDKDEDSSIAVVVDDEETEETPQSDEEINNNIQKEKEKEPTQQQKVSETVVDYVEKVADVNVVTTSSEEKEVKLSATETTSNSSLSEDEFGQKDIISEASELSYSSIDDTEFDKEKKSEEPEQNIVDQHEQSSESIQIPPIEPDNIILSEFAGECVFNYTQFATERLALIPHEKKPPSKQSSEPVFVTLANQIRTLQANQSIYDQFLAQVTTCYEMRLQDMRIQINDTNTRLDQLQSRFHLLEKQAIYSVFPADIQTILIGCYSIFFLGLIVKRLLRRKAVIDKKYEQDNSPPATLYHSSYDRNVDNISKRNRNDSVQGINYDASSPREPDRSAGGRSRKEQDFNSELLQPKGPEFPVERRLMTTLVS